MDIRKSKISDNKSASTMSDSNARQIIRDDKKISADQISDNKSASKVSDNKLVTLVEPELSYKIVGVLFKVHTALGAGHQERYYQRACAIGFENEGIFFKKELKIPFEYEGKSLGSYYLDFLIEDKIPLEFKVTKEFSKANVGQLLRYLRKTNKQLGMLVNFGNKGLEYKRIINSEYESHE